MSELIDREATVKQICKIGEMLGGRARDVVISIALFVQDDKTAFPTISIPVAELDTTKDFAQWIPCSERLPEEDGKYLVCWCGAWGVDICFAEYSKCGKYWHAKYGGEYRGITAWMPLPEPYRGRR